MRPAASIAATALLFCATDAASQRNAGPSLEQLLQRGTSYVETFVTAFSRVVAEERYVQDRLELRLEGSRGTFLGTPQKTESRTLRSDLLLVLPRGADEWAVFRDVFEVDGRPVRDREDRLTRLFLDESSDRATAYDRAEQIATEGNRFHFQEAGTYDHPLFALGLLQRSYRTRFRFTARGRDESLGPDAWIVAFNELGQPTVIRGPNGTNILARGRLWIEGASGRVLQTELVVAALGVQSTVTTSFAFDQPLGAYVPTQMRTRFRRGVMASEVHGVATYSRFRQFEVRTQERIQN